MLLKLLLLNKRTLHWLIALRLYLEVKIILFNIVSVKDAINSLSSISNSVWRLSEGRWNRSLSCRIVFSVGSVISCVICVMLICFLVSVLELCGVTDYVQRHKLYVVETKIYNYTTLGII